MGKFISDFTEGLGIYPAIAFIIFSVFFLVVLFIVFTRDRKSYDKMKQVPFLESENSDNI